MKGSEPHPGTNDPTDGPSCPFERNGISRWIGVVHERREDLAREQIEASPRTAPKRIKFGIARPAEQDGNVGAATKGLRHFVVASRARQNRIATQFRG